MVREQLTLNLRADERFALISQTVSPMLSYLVVFCFLNIVHFLFPYRLCASVTASRRRTVISLRSSRIDLQIPETPRQLDLSVGAYDQFRRRRRHCGCDAAEAIDAFVAGRRFGRSGQSSSATRG